MPKISNLNKESDVLEEMKYKRIKNPPTQINNIPKRVMIFIIIYQ
jgi:hypothetical protein